jgi:polyribonucleotide nucleotidyltransferase
MLQAIMFGHDVIKQLISFQEKINADFNTEKMEFESFGIDQDLYHEVYILKV